MSGKVGVARGNHSVSVPEPLWLDLVALKGSKPGLCSSPRSFILAATRRELAVYQTGSTSGPRFESESITTSVAGPAPRVETSSDLKFEEDQEVLAAIGNAGTTGITTKQLSSVTQLPVKTVEREIGQLSTSRQISRFGRGLWVLDRFSGFGGQEPTFKGTAWYDERFQSAYNIKIGRYEGGIQFSPNERLPAHRWWPYVQGFSAEFVTQICSRYGVRQGSVVLDPFCGSGTVPIVARQLGALGIGIDMMPIVAFVADAKCEWGVAPGALSDLAGAVLADRSPPTLSPPFLRETSKQFRLEVLRSLLRLKENIWSLGTGPTQKLLRLAFSSILIDCSNLKRAPCLGYTNKKGLDADSPYRLFELAVSRIAEDLTVLQMRREGWGPPAEILCGDAGEVQLRPESIDLAVTSPPYVNGMDYPTNYKIDLAWMDFVRSYEELAALRASMVACDNIPRATATEHRPSDAVRSDKWLEAIVDEIGKNIRTKGIYRRDDMGSIVRKYFDDLIPAIENVLSSLKPGGRFVVVNGDSLIAGTYVPGDMIFARIAQRAGFAVEGFNLARVRRSGQRRGFMLRESVTTLRKPQNGAPSLLGESVRT